MSKSEKKYIRSMGRTQSFSFAIVSLVLVSQVALAADIQVLRSKSKIEVLEQSVTKNLLTCKNEEGELKERAKALQNAIGSLNEMKRVNLVSSLKPYQQQTEEIKTLLSSLSPEIDKTLIAADASKEQLLMLHEFAHAKFLYAFLLLSGIDHNEQTHNERSSILNQCTTIYENIANRTDIQSSFPQIDRIEMGAQSRLWLAIIPLVQNKLDTTRERLDNLRKYLEFFETESINSDTIDRTQWTMKLLECELSYMQSDFGKCAALVDEYYGEILNDLTPDSRVTTATITALEALRHQIQSLNYLQEEIAAPTQTDVNERLWIIKKAEFLASFGDTHIHENAPMDFWKLRVILLGYCYGQYGMVDKMGKLNSDIYNLDPVRFKDLEGLASSYEMSLQVKQLIKDSEYERR